MNNSDKQEIILKHFKHFIDITPDYVNEITIMVGYDILQGFKANYSIDIVDITKTLQEALPGKIIKILVQREGRVHDITSIKNLYSTTTDSTKASEYTYYPYG